MNRDEIKIDILDTDDAKVAEMLAGLKRVSAPANFEFRLKAKISAAKRPAAGGNFVPALIKFAAPVVLLTAIGSLFFLTGPVAVNQPTAPAASVAAPVAETPRAADSLVAVLPASDEKAPPVRAAAAVNRDASARKTAPLRDLPVRMDQKTANGQSGSTVRAVTPAKIILPEGIDPNAAIRDAQSPPDSKTQVTAADVLPKLGIDAGYGEGGWKVRSVRSNSSAARAGVKTGDVLESVDGTPLVKDGVLKGSFNGSTVTVRRGGKLVSLSLLNK